MFGKTSYFDISYKSENSLGSVKYEVSNSFFYFGEKGANKALFKDAVGNIEINHRLHNDNYEYYWTNYSINAETLINGNLITPTFTVSACHKEIDVFDSMLFGVKRVLIFGDSLSDNGNLYAYSLQLLPKSTPYYRGMFSNGQVWSEQLTSRLALNNIAVNNYAVGGSTVILFPEWANNGSPYVLNDEVNLYLNLDASDDITDELAIFFIGGNDYLTSNPAMDNIEDAVRQVTDGITSAVEQVNAKQTVIIGLPNLSITGESKSLENQKVLEKISIAHNQVLKAYANKHNMKFIDINTIFSELVNDTKSFNDKHHTIIDPANLNKSCWKGGYFTSTQELNDAYADLANKESSKNNYVNDNKISNLLSQDSMRNIVDSSYDGSMCSHPQNYAFWDHVHPTYQVHKAMYEYIVKELGAKSFTK